MTLRHFRLEIFYVSFAFFDEKYSFADDHFLAVFINLIHIFSSDVNLGFRFKFFRESSVMKRWFNGNK